MINPLDKPFDLKINGKSFKLDFECILYQNRQKPLTLKVALFNTYLQKIQNCSLEVAGVEVFKSMENIENPTTKDEKDNDGIVELTLNVGEITRELNFKAIGVHPELELINNHKGITNSNITKLNKQSKIFPSEFNKLGSLDKIKKIFKDNKKDFLTYYVQSKKVMFIPRDYKSNNINEIKANTSKFRIFNVEQNLDKDLLLLKGIPYFLLEVGSQIKYKSRDLKQQNNQYSNIFATKDTEKTYIVDSIEMTVSTRKGVQAEYKCKTLEVIKREIDNANNQRNS